MILHLFKPLECTTSRANCNETYGLQSIVDSSFPTSVLCWRWGRLYMCEKVCAPSSQFCCELLIALKKLNLKKKREEKIAIKKSSLCETFNLNSLRMMHLKGVPSFMFNQVAHLYFCFYFHYSRRWVIEDLALIYVIECSAYVLL